ncbi:hypothetical protein DYB32_002703 [Aphanomyces invadans]|uniref:BEACH domain-containing protein n=1 Tax=Aphanomyces invadans TaxID=157072 RepID=A0A418B2R4_9STRA|nr:hypothetical protein DYB32_002703 [Aphanomyces invadans]
MVGMLSNATILDRQRCEVLNVMRLAVDLYAPRTTCIRDVVSMAVDTIATSSAFNAGLVWYLHDTHAIATVVDTMRLLATATVVTSENADVAIGWFEAAYTQHSSLLSSAPSPHGNNAEDDVHVAVSKALGLYKEKPKDPIAPLVDPGNDVDAAPPRPPQNEIRPAAESAATSTTPTATYSLVSHEPSVGHKLVLTILQASCRFSFVLVLDFGTTGGYNVVWSIANRSAKDKSSQGQAEDGMHLFVGLLPLGEGVAKPLESDDWSLNACGAWNDAALIALRDFLGVHIEDATKTALLAPWLNVVHQIYATRTDQFKRVETKTQLVASLVAKFQTIASRHAQDVVLACVQHMAAVPELALLLCRSLATMLHQVPTPDHALRETLLDAGLVDRGLVAAFKQIQQAESASVDDATGNSKYIQEICALVCLVLHNHVAACTQFRQHHVHLILYVVLTARIHDPETFQSVFNILVALSGVTKSPLLIEGIEDDVRMLLDVMQRCCREHNTQSLHTLLALLCQYLRNNVTVQRIWRDKMSGMEGLLSALSTLQDHASDFPVLETLLSIVSSLLDAPDTRQYALDHHIYHTIADCIVASGWLASSHAADVLTFLMGLVFQATKGESSCAPTVGRYNPDAGVMSFRVYPHLDRGQRSDVLSSWMSHLENLTKPNGDKAKLIAAGVFKWILPLVQVDPLPLLPLIAVLATVDIPMPHLRHYLRVVHHTPGRGLPMLDTMSKVPTVPHTELHHHSYIQVTTYDKVWPPPSGYSFACWFQFPPPDEAQGPSHTVTVPMCEGHLVMDHGLGATYAVLVGSTLSLYRCKEDAVSGAKELGLLEIFEYAEEGIAGFRICSNDDWFAATVVDPDGAPAWKKALQVYSKPYVMLVSMYTLDQPQCFTRVYFDPATTCLRVETSQKHVLFKNIDIGLFAPKSWHHLVFTHKRAVMGSSLATLYIDGGEIGAKKLSYPAVSTMPGPIRCFLGSDPHLFPSTKIRSICLGPMWLMGDVLPPLAATCMFTLGPAYMHSFPGNGTSQGAIDEWTETTLAAFLHRIIHRKVDVARAAKRLQLRNLALATQKDWQSEMVVSWIDKEDSAIYATMWFRYFIDRHCSMKALGMEWLALVSSFKWTDDTLVLWNLHTDVPNSPQTHVHYADSEPTIPLNLGKLVPSLGGLWSVLVPLADSLDTTADLHRFLRVLTRCLQANPATLAWFLEQKGHAWVTTLLLQHMDLVDASILKAAAKLAISGSLSPHKQAKQPPPLDAKVAHPVIIDVHAITSVLFNVAFRTALPRPLQRELVVLLAYTIQPQNPNAVFNARQLRQSQFIQWCLHLISQICRAGDPGSELKDDLLLTETQQLLATYVQVEVHVDDMLQYSDMLLCALMDADAASLRCTLLHFLVHHVESSPVVARTVVDSVLYRLHQDKKKGMASATSPTGSGSTSPHWCPHDSTFSTDGLEHVLLETICRSKLSPDTPQQPADAQLASRLLFTLAQVQPAFAMHLLVNSQLHVRLKQVLALHAGHAATYVPLLAFVGLIPLSNVAVSSDGSGDDLTGTATFPAKYTPTAMDRDCIDAVWDILGHLWHIRQCTLPTDTTTVAVIMWLNQRLHSDMLFFQAVCRSSCAFLAVILRCRVLPTRSTTEATDNVAPLPISQAGEVCLVTFANQSLVERDDWADNMLFCLHIWPSTASQHDWFSLVTAIVSNAKILEGCASVVAMKNVCSLLLGLLRLIVCRRKRGDKLKRVDPTPSKVKAPNEAWPADLTSTVLAFVCHVIRASEKAAMASVLGDEAIQHFYNVLVFCAQAFVLQALYPMQHVASWHLDVLRVVVASKDQFLQQTNVSNVLLYTGSAAAPPIADASAFRLHMRQLSLQGSQKEFVVGQDSDKLFVQCLATALFRILLADPACFEVTQLWQYLLQQRMGLVKEMLILDVKPTLLTTMSTAKKEPLDVFHHGFDQILGIDSLDHCQYRVFFQWIQAQSTLLEDVFSTRTDPMYNQLVDVLEGTLSLRHPKHGQWAIRVAVDPPAPYPLLESTARDECADEAMVQLASEKASVRLAQFVSSQRDDSKQSKAKWDRELANAKYTRSLWSEPVEMHARPTQTVYQLSWEYTALDATEGPGRKRVRLKWQDTPIRPGRASSSAQTPSGAPAKKAASFRVSSEARRYLEFHDAVEVYRQCTYKHDLVDLTNGVWLMCDESLYFVEGYIVVDDQQQLTKSLADLRAGSEKPGGGVMQKPNTSLTSPVVWRLKYSDIKQFYRIKFQLRPVGLELVDTGGWTYFCTFDSARCREDVFKALFQMPIHNSIYWAHVLRPAPFRSMKRLRQSLTKKWLRGAMSNFEYLIELNALAGRTFNDVTQYPVFPWVLADYTSDVLDLSKDATYRDLSKPMGGLGAKRAEQFRERYAAMATDGFDGSPAFHYGTHYSCSAYVTYYLVRLEPFASMAQELQDVRELIPEFFFLPEFLVNANHFDLGTTQNGDAVRDVLLPPWARNDPREFIRLHRRAIEAYVKWHTPLAPPLVSIGKEYVYLKKAHAAQVLDEPVGDVKVTADNKVRHRHEDAVTCVAIDTAFSIILSGSKDCSAIVWDLRTRRYLRDLRGHDAPLSHVGVNGANGNLVTIANTQVRMWSINGDLLAGALLPTLGLSPITAALCTTCDMWQNGVVAVTGHSNGTIACWGVKYPTDAEAPGPDVKPTFSVTADKSRASGNAVVVAPSCHLVVMKLLIEHRSSVTALAMTPDQRQVISGDADGWCMRWIDDSLTSGAT